MIKKIAAGVLKWTHNYIPQKENDEVIEYGLEILIENTMKYVLVILVGVLLETAGDFAIVLLCFSVLRLQAGGYHAKTNLGCFICMILICLGTSFTGEYVKVTNFILICSYTISMFINRILTPNGVMIDKLLNEKQIKKKKYKSYLYLTLIYICAYIFPVKNHVVVASMSEALLLIIAEVRRKIDEK